MLSIASLRRLLLDPLNTWRDVANDDDSASIHLFALYALPLAAIGPLASLVAMLTIGGSTVLGAFRLEPLVAVAIALSAYVLALLGLGVTAVLIDALAPTFGGQRNFNRATKLAIYTATPAWLSGIFQLLPALGALTIIGALYGIYLLYLGLPVVMESRREKNVAYTALVVVGTFVVMLVGSGITSSITGAMVSSAWVAPSMGGVLPGDDKTRALAQQADIAVRTPAGADAGRAAQHVAAVIPVSGSKSIDPKLLAGLLPATAGGLQRLGQELTAPRTENSMSRADAMYSDGKGRDVTVSIIDMNGAPRTMAMWVEGELRGDDGKSFERSFRAGNLLVHEERDAAANMSSYGVLVDGRFMVEASGFGVDLEMVRAIVGRIDLSRLETLARNGA